MIKNVNENLSPITCNKNLKNNTVLKVFNSEEFQKMHLLATVLKNVTLKESNICGVVGLGFSANQYGFKEALFILKKDFTNLKCKEYLPFLNPKIISYSSEENEIWEYCFSDKKE